MAQVSTPGIFCYAEPEEHVIQMALPSLQYPDLDPILRNASRFAALEKRSDEAPARDAAFDRIAELLRAALNADAAMVKLFEDDRQLLKGVAGIFEPAASEFCRLTVSSRKALLIPDVAAELAGATGAYAGVPLFDEDGNALGTLCAISRTPRDWSARDCSLLQQFASFVGADVVDRERTMRALQARGDELRLELADTNLLQSVSAAMIEEENVDALYKKIVDAAVQIMCSDYGSMQMLYPERGECGELLLLASYGLSPEAQAYWKWVGVDAGSTCGQSLRTLTRTIAADYRDCEFALRRNDLAAFMEAGIYAAQSTPLFSRKGQLLGMVTTHWKRPHQPSEHDLRLFDILARQAADLIERRLAEKALRESEQRFRAFVATSSDIVYCMNADWSEMQQLEGRAFVVPTLAPNADWINTYIHPDDQAQVRLRIDESVAAQSTFDLEHRIIRTDGTLGWVHSRAIPLFDDSGEIAQWLGTATDISLRKEAEVRQKHALRESQRMVETLQTAFLPQTMPQLEHVRFDAAYLPAGEGALVGGDWFDAAELPDGRILLCVGDVTGHGLSAAVTAGKLRQAATVAALTVADPGEILRILNRVLRFQQPDIYATAMLAFIDSDCKELIYASAGHPSAFLATSASAGAIELERGGLPLGVNDEFEAATHRVELPPDFVVALYSDGLTEFARDITAAEEAIKSTIAIVAERPPMQRAATFVLERVLGDVRPSDDVVLLLVQRNAKPSALTGAQPDTASLKAMKTWHFHSSDEPAVREVRAELVRLTGALRADPDTAFAAQIILGEALANTVEHAPGMVQVAIECSEENLVITTRDRGPGFHSARRTLPDELDERGRGLFLMEALAAQLTVRSEENGGTEMRAVLPLTRTL